MQPLSYSELAFNWMEYRETACQNVKFVQRAALKKLLGEKNTVNWYSVIKIGKTT